MTKAVGLAGQTGHVCVLGGLYGMADCAASRGPASAVFLPSPQPRRDPSYLTVLLLSFHVVLGHLSDVSGPWLPLSIRKVWS